MNKPVITNDNYYDRKSLFKVVIFYGKQYQLPLEYLLAVFETLYPFFKTRAAAEEALEVALYQYADPENRTPLSQIVSIIIHDLDNFKKHRMME